MRDPDPMCAEALDLGGREVDAVGAPDVALEPADPLQVLDRRAAVELAAVGVLFPRLRQVRVEHEPEPACGGGGLLHQTGRDRERRARRDRDLHHRPVGKAREALGVGEHLVDLLDEVVRRQAPVRDAEVHRPT